MKRLLLPALFALLIAACGDDAPSGDGNGEPPPPQSVSVTLDDFSFDPETVTVAAGAEVTITADNVAGSEHDWTLVAAGAEVERAADLDAADIIVKVSVAAGQSATETFTAPSPGIYQVICTLAGHMELGMEGTLVVE